MRQVRERRTLEAEGAVEVLSARKVERSQRASESEKSWQGLTSFPVCRRKTEVSTTRKARKREKERTK